MTNWPDQLEDFAMTDNVTLQFREPMGVIAAIVPWNFPLTNAAIKLAPILCALGSEKSPWPE